MCVCVCVCYRTDLHIYTYWGMEWMIMAGEDDYDDEPN